MTDYKKLAEWFINMTHNYNKEPKLVHNIALALHEAEERGRRLENEECAKVADNMHGKNHNGVSWVGTPTEIAKAIRTRNSAEPKKSCRYDCLGTCTNKDCYWHCRPNGRKRKP